MRIEVVSENRSFVTNDLRSSSLVGSGNIGLSDMAAGEFESFLTMSSSCGLVCSRSPCSSIFLETYWFHQPKSIEKL